MTKAARILVVERDTAIREFVSMALSDEGYMVTTIDNEIASLPLITTFHPDLVILDIPEQENNEQRFIQAYRQTIPSAPVVGWGTSVDAKKHAQALHVTDYLEKPFNLDDLLGILTRHLQ
jgi:DNA-binding NtrC family response regulator